MSVTKGELRSVDNCRTADYYFLEGRRQSQPGNQYERGSEFQWILPAEGNKANGGKSRGSGMTNHTHPEEVMTHASDHIDIQNVIRKFVFVNDENLSKVDL